MDNTKHSEGNELKFSEVCLAILNKIWIVAIATFVLALGAFLYSKLLVTPMYNSSTSLYVINNAENENTSAADISIATTLVKDYEKLVTSNRVLGAVIEELELDLTTGGLRGKVSVANEAGTRILNINVVDSDPEQAQLIADSIREKVKEELPKIMKVEAETIDVANLPRAPYSPNTFSTVLLAALAGALLSSIAIVVAYILNDKIKTADDIEKHLGLSVLGVIPKTGGRGSRYYGKYGYGKYGKNKSTVYAPKSDN